MRYFNTTGPVRADKHYGLPPLGRLDLDEVLRLIEQEKYFVLHAPRQTGKTTCLLALARRLNESGRYRCLYANVEGAQAAREDVARGIKAVAAEMGTRARDMLDDDIWLTQINSVLAQTGPEKALNELLALWCRRAAEPAILLIDEIDTLIGDTLISVLRQLRSGYDMRPEGFPQSIILCGVRDVRDYRIQSSHAKKIITGGSAFNIKAKSLRLGDFSAQQVATLYRQYSDETGQAFSDRAIDRAFELTAGQPWLVNALAYEVCFEMAAGRERSTTVTADLVDEARERLILRRDTHLDQLMDTLQDERIRRVMAPILTGETGSQKFKTDDVQYAIDLGLLRREGSALTVANPIYNEIIPRELTWGSQLAIVQEQAWYLTPDNRLDMGKLLTAFQTFFRQHSEHWSQIEPYHEAGPQLLMQAFLQRVVNAGGRIEREYGMGRGRTDLFVEKKPAGQ